MKLNINRIFILFFFVFISFFHLTAEPELPLNSSQYKPDQVLKNVIKICNQFHIPEKDNILTAKQINENKALYKVVDAFFDADYMIAEAFKDQLPKMSSTQKEKVNNLIKELIRLIAYPLIKTFYKSIEYRINDTVIEGDQAFVEIWHRKAEIDIEFNSYYFFIKKGDIWQIRNFAYKLKVHDFISKYRRLFNKNIDAKGLSELIKTLEKEYQKKLAALTKGK